MHHAQAPPTLTVIQAVPLLLPVSPIAVAIARNFYQHLGASHAH
ncbi:hypothetical protein [Laspinema olomoucense]|nr:hypothetical protein [Laspinema sp. D3a]